MPPQAVVLVPRKLAFFVIGGFLTFSMALWMYPIAVVELIVCIHALSHSIRG